MLHDDLLVWVVELDCELGRKNGFRRRYRTAIRADRFYREAGLRPFWDHGNLAVNDVGYVGVIKGDAVAVVRGREGRIEGAKSVGGFRVISMLSGVDGTLLRGL